MFFNKTIKILRCQLWRWTFLWEVIFYLKQCENFKEIIEARKTGSPLDKIVLRNGLIFKIAGPTTNALCMFREVWKSKAYARAFVGRKPDIVVDIGAHFGFFTIKAACLWPSAKIFAYEPSPRNFVILKENVSKNKIPNIVLSNDAVAGKAGFRPFYIKNKLEADSLIHNNASGNIAEETTQVKTTTLRHIVNSLGQQNIDLLKMDCEGAEYEILESSLDILNAYVKCLLIEIHLDMIGINAKTPLETSIKKMGFQTVCLQKYPPAVILLAVKKR